MPEIKGKIPTVDEAQRIATVVRAVEGQPIDLRGKRLPYRPPTSSGGTTTARFKTTSGTLYTGNVMLAKKFDGTTLSGSDIPIMVTQGHANNQELIATMVEGNTGATYSGSPVQWFEIVKLSVSQTPHQVIKVLDSSGRIGPGSVALEG